MSRRPANFSFYGERLVEIRRFRGLSQTGLASQVGISREMIRQYEMGKKYPSRLVLLQLASHLQIPVSYFTSKLYSQPGNETPVFFRKLQRTQVHARDSLGVYQLWLEHLYSYFEQYVQFPVCEELWMINRGDPRDPLSQDEIEMYAARARGSLGIGPGPISHVMLLLEKKGLIIGQVPKIDSDIDACSRRKGAKGFVLLGMKKSAVRQRFDLAHEFGHLVLHHRITADDIAANPALHKRLENEANSFAGAFLIPQASFLREFMVPSVDTLLRMKSHWKVSLAAIAQRAKELQLISDRFMEQFQIQRSARGWRLKEPLDDEIPLEMPSMLAKAVKILIEHDVLSKGDLLRTVALPQEDIYSLIGIDEDFFEKQEEPVKLTMIRGGRHNT